MAVGTGLWFTLTTEPQAGAYLLAAAVLLTGIALRWRGAEGLHAPGIALFCLALGFMAAGARAHLLAAPILDGRYYGPVQGRIVMIDRAQSDRMRLTLDRVILADLAPDATPARVRVSLHGDQAHLRPEPGQTVLMTAHLSPPDGPVEPGAFDFQRMAFFDRLGAVGYTRVPAVIWAPPAPGEQRINRLRALIRAGVEARIGGEPGAFSAALLTGDRAGIGQAVLEDLRRSNLAHLLAISGLHMGLLAGIFFGGARLALAAVPVLALRLPVKKVAAVVALMAGGIYLALSGGNVATERAYVMVSVMLGAVLFDRRALSLRSVALAAVILLLIQPEALLEPGFQMSFAATVALVAGFAAVYGTGNAGGKGGGGAGAGMRRMPRWLRPVFTLILSSTLAGLATAPVGAAHFNRLSSYGLVANLMAVPVMGTAVMPAAALAGLLVPFGLEAPALWVMEQGTRWILWVAALVAELDHSVHPVPQPGMLVLPLLALGGLWMILWRGPLALAGLPPVLAAFAIWAGAERPQVLITSDGGIVGLMTPQGRSLSAPQGGSFAVRQWLENDGDMALQDDAAVRPGFHGEARERRFTFGTWRAVQIKGKGAADRLQAVCAGADLVILAGFAPRDAAPGPCLLIDARLLRRTGAVSLTDLGGGRLRLDPARARARLWTGGKASAAMILSRPRAEKGPEITSERNAAGLEDVPKQP
ncbi:ComEC/Rec2 family competence protein [Szabonella alba]|uniref:ComEC/Rec2 family competence protein n=1 Tax=Szabonella alba TaxID=2804194 RepID=A0A8K0V847_9RHOB|nr:ComEC/Rec2 family competence protein [Szabonella alba]MBL4917469.1 ComEC/Rec2 family competence protein [Szabonella alba]